MQAAAAFAAETGAVIIPPFDHPDVIAGQGTLGLEILEQVPDVDDDRRADRRRRPRGRHRERGQAARRRARSHDPGRRGAGRERRALRRLARRRRTRADTGRADDRRRHRRVPARASSTSPIIRDAVDEVVTVERGRHRARAARAPRAREARRRAGRRGRGRGAHDGCGAVPTARSSRCSRAATSIRCSCSG